MVLLNRINVDWRLDVKASTPSVTVTLRLSLPGSRQLLLCLGAALLINLIFHKKYDHPKASLVQINNILG